MFELKKILTPFLLPPGIFISLLIISGLWSLIKKYWKFGLTNIFIALLMWSLSITPVSDIIMKGLEADLKIPANPEGDVIILLGGGVYDTVPDLSGTGSPSEDMTGRIVTAVRLQKKVHVPIIVSGGAVFKGNKSEAPIIRRFLMDLGVPEDEIIVEDKSRDTSENANNTKIICDKKGYSKPMLVTSGLHMKRSVLSFDKAGMTVTPIPANLRTSSVRQYMWHDYLPLLASFDNSAFAMHEYLGLLFYKLAY
ncbi:MAG: YdcF family protein [Dissulfurispiraceae bacterium]|jgi:uncharacterized SAM-binding protein YcdF (DUF218 family)